ncbi:hypothetical protein IAT38_008119 [Cryptococcus sp. DSM 104549]
MEYNELQAGGGRGSSNGGIVWSNGQPTLRMEDAVVETVVTHTTRTTTTLQPIVLPRIPPPDNLNLPLHLSSERYPLADQPAPPDMRYFTLMLGGRRVIVQDDSAGPLSADCPTQVSGPGWTRTLLNTSPSATTEPGYMGMAAPGDERLGFLQALNRSKAKEARKRPHHSSRSVSGQELREATKGDAPTPPVTAEANRQRSPPRKKPRGLEELSIPQGNTSLLSPLPSPEHEGAPLTASGGSVQPNFGSGTELSALFSLPSLVSTFDELPDRLQQHLLMHLLRRSRLPTIQRVSGFISNALKRDFIALLPHEVAIQILKKIDGSSLASASRVCKRWRRMIDTERTVWKQRLIDDDLWYGQGTEEEEEALVLDRYEALDLQQQMLGQEEDPSDDERMLSAGLHNRTLIDLGRPTPLKHVFRRRFQNKKNWIHTRPEHSSFAGHGSNVVTCLQFDEDKIVSASDDHSINIYNTADGQLRKRLDGHEGGVWTLEYKGGTLVSGSTDRTVRVWDMDTLKLTHVFTGHTSTVRCLQIVEPVWDEHTKEFQPPYPLIVTGSRDSTLRVWRLPQKDDPRYEQMMFDPDSDSEPLSVDENPFHKHLLSGHTSAVRALACHGNICVSGSYDTTVKVWDIVKGTLLHTLNGHEAKVYSIVYDRYRNRCASGSMDNTVKVWDVITGECLHTLNGHTSLVGLLGLSPNYLVSAAADSSLRIWDPTSCQLKNVLASHGGAITCFQHDETKVVSGSDGTLKLWDIRTGAFVRDLVVGISSVWQVAFNGNLLVAASNRNNQTVFDVFNFGTTAPMAEVDDDKLDRLQPPVWARDSKEQPNWEGEEGEGSSLTMQGQSPWGEAWGELSDAEVNSLVTNMPLAGPSSHLPVPVEPHDLYPSHPASSRRARMMKLEHEGGDDAQGDAMTVPGAPLPRHATLPPPPAFGDDGSAAESGSQELGNAEPGPSTRSYQSRRQRLAPESGSPTPTSKSKGKAVLVPRQSFSRPVGTSSSGGAGGSGSGSGSGTSDARIKQEEGELPQPIDAAAFYAGSTNYEEDEVMEEAEEL